MSSTQVRLETLENLLLNPADEQNPHQVEYLAENNVYCGDARELLKQVRPDSVALSFWSPPYYVGKSYEQHLTFKDWQALIKEVIRLHVPAIKPGGFLCINIADILAFPDPEMPRIQADNVSIKR